jgi:hypothetical protein
VFPGNALTDGDLTVTWTDGGLKPNRKLAKLLPDMDMPASGSLFIGEQGTMVLAHVGAPILSPAAQFKDYKYPTMGKVESHWHRWVDAILNQGATTDSFAYAGWLSETVQLGNVATRLAKHAGGSRGGQVVEGADVTPLDWDAAAMKFPSAPEADALLTKPYRAGWDVPAA